MTAHPPTGGAPATAPPELAPRAFLEALLGEKPRPEAAVRVALNRPPSEGEGAGTWQETAAPDVPAALAFLARHEGEGDTYVSPAWTAGGKGAEHVVARRTLSVEVDWKAMPGSTPEERRHQARSLLGATPCPLIAVASGHGLHGHLLLPAGERIEDYDDPEDGRRHFEILGRAWRLFLEDKARQLFGAPVELDRCHGCERVWRPPGGWNTKAGEGGRTLTADRARWKAVRLLHPGQPEGLAHVAEADLEFLIPFVAAAEAEQAEAEARKNGAHRARSHAADVPAPFDLDLLPESLRRRWPFADMNPSKADYLVAIGLARAGQSETVAATALRARRAAAGAGREKAARQDYVEGTVAKAFHEASRTRSPESQPRVAPPPPPRQPFPLHALPRVIRRYVQEGAACLQCCVSMVALPVLVVLAAALGTTRRIRLRGGAKPWAEPAVLWAAVVVESGCLKSPALDLGLDLIRRHEAAAGQANDEAWKRFERAQECYQRDILRFRRSKSDGDPPLRPERPRLRRYLVVDTTIEAVADRLVDNPRGLLLGRDELSAWFKSFDAYRAGGRGGDAAKWLELHHARPLWVDRKTGDRATIHIPRAAVSIVGGIQPDTLKRVLTPEFMDNGLAARLLLTMPPRPRPRWNEAEVSRDSVQQLEGVLDRLLALEPGAGGDGEPVDIVLTPGAKAAWVQFFNEHARAGEDLDGSLAATWSKAEGYAARFALVINLVRWAAGDPSATGAVQEEDIHAGVTLARWFAAEAERVYAMLAESADAADRRRLADWIHARGGRVTPRDLARGPRRYRNNEADAEQALHDLVRAGWGTWQDAPASEQGGRPTRRFVLRAERTAGGDAPGTTPQDPFEGVTDGGRHEEAESQEYDFQGQPRERGPL